MIEVQFDLFKTKEEIRLEAIEESSAKTQKTVDNVRKGTYARINEMKKECQELRTRLEILEKYICNKGLDDECKPEKL